MKHFLHNHFKQALLALLLVLASTQVTFAQTGSVKGVVSDAAGDPLPGVSIVVDGTSLGTTTNTNGIFILNNVPVGNQLLKISYIGFETITKSVKITGGKTIELPLTLKESTYSLNEIEVTASKRTEMIKDVPMAISAITTKGIEEMGITDTKDYLATIPGLYVNTSNPGQCMVNIRGVAPLGGWAQTVGYYLGETPMPYLAMASSFDIERIEVLRGPQGTLYGEGSMGGTIKIIPNEANAGKFEAMVNPEVSSTTGGGINYIVNGMVNVPIIKDKLALRATGFYQNDDGFINNIGLGVENSNTFKNYGARFSLRYFANDKLMITASAIFNKSETGGRFVANEHMETFTSIVEPTTYNYNTYTLSAYYDLSFASLTVTGSYLKNGRHDVQDLNGLLPTVNYILSLGGIDARTGLWTDGATNSETYSAEARLVSSSDGPFKWTTGLYYKDMSYDGTLVADSDPHLDADLISGLMEFGFGVPGVTELYHDRFGYDIRQIALFGEVSFDITPKLNVLAGLRLMNEKRNFSSFTHGMFPILMTGLAPELRESTGDENVINPKFVVSYKPSNKLLVYINASKGFRSGGQNLYAFMYPGSPETYKSETLWNYEFGIKSTILDRKLIANAAIYYNDWKNMQVITRSISDLNLTENVGKAHTAGVDAELSWLPIKSLLFNLAANYAIAKTDVEINTPAGVDPNTGDEIFNTIPAGTQLESIPALSFNFATQFKFTLTENMSLTPRIDYNYKGKNIDYYIDMLNPIDIPAYGLTNLRLTFEHKGLNVYAFAKNVTNEKVLNGYYIKHTDPAIGNLYKVGQPRTIGLGLSFSF